MSDRPLPRLEEPRTQAESIELEERMSPSIDGAIRDRADRLYDYFPAAHASDDVAVRRARLELTGSPR